MNTWTIKILDIPPLPENLRSLIDLNPEMIKQDGSVRHDVFDSHGIHNGRMHPRKLYNSTGVKSAATVAVMTAPTEISQWVDNNIITGWKDVRVSYFYKNDSTSTGPHTDQLRDFSLIYNINHGGPGTRLTFWREKNQPLFRPHAVQAENLDDLEIIQEIEGPYDCWYLINAHVLHSVENLASTRINVQVSLYEHHREEILKLAKDHV